MVRLDRNRPTANDAAPAHRRVAPATVVSILLHVVAGLAIWNALLMPVAIERFFRTDTQAVARERLEFVTVAPNGQPSSPSVPRSPAVGVQRLTQAPAQVPLVAPQRIPSSIPAPAATAPSPGVPTGPMIGGTGPSKGVQPTYVDPRVWVPNPPLVYAPKTDEERLDSAVVATVRRHQDSVAANAYSPNKYERGDWTVERNGRTYGIDQNFIRLGKFSIPTALLALLPFNRQANPIEADRARAMSAMRADILYHAQNALNEEEFRQAVRAIRDRKEREHKSQQQRLPGRKGDPHTIVAPGDRPPEYRPPE